MSDRVAIGLPVGRPKNRTRTLSGDRRALVDEQPLWGPDVHGVYWRPVRAYYENGETLLVTAPVHPDELPRGVR